MGRERMISGTDDVDMCSGYILWDLASCEMTEVMMDVVRKRLPRLGHELGVHQPYDNLRLEIFQCGDERNLEMDSVTEEEDAQLTRKPGLHFHHMSCPTPPYYRDALNSAIIRRMHQLTDCPKPIIIVSDEIGTEQQPGPLRVGWKLFGKDMVVICRSPDTRSPLENFLKARRLRTYGWPPKGDRDFESLLFHLDPAHEFPQGTNQVMNPLLFIAGVSAVYIPLFYSLLSWMT